MRTQQILHLMVLILLIALSSPIAVAQEAPFPNEKPWSWYLQPQPAKKGMSLAGDSTVLVLRDIGPRGIHVVLISLSDLTGVFDLRAIAIDNSRKRYQLKGMGGASSNGVWMRSFLIPTDQTSWDKLEFLGIEELTVENQRAVIVPRALKNLDDAGLEALRYPEIGKPYPFALTTIDGSKLSSQILQGKVVLFDFWASWCAPCLQLIPDLKNTYADLKNRGFEVIGINLDDSVDKAREVALKENLPWPIVVAPTDKQQRELWETAAGIQSIPRLWLIDRKGILRADVSPGNLREEIHRLVNE